MSIHHHRLIRSLLSRIRGLQARLDRAEQRASAERVYRRDLEDRRDADRQREYDRSYERENIMRDVERAHRYGDAYREDVALRRLRRLS